MFKTLTSSSSKRFLSTTFTQNRWLNPNPKTFELKDQHEKPTFRTIKGVKIENLGKSPIKNFRRYQRELLTDQKFVGGKKVRDKHIAELWKSMTHEEKLTFKDGRFENNYLVAGQNGGAKNDVNNQTNAEIEEILADEIINNLDLDGIQDSSEYQKLYDELEPEHKIIEKTTNSQKIKHTTAYDIFREERLAEDSKITEEQLKEEFGFLSDLSIEMYSEEAIARETNKIIL